MAQPKSTSLKRELGVLEVFCIASGAMISSGLFVLPGIAYAKAGPAVIVAYMLAAILMVPSVFAKAELATAMPRAGGTYFYIERGLGPLAGVLAGFASWFSISCKSAFALVGIGAFATLIFPDVAPSQMKLVAAGFCLLFTALNLVSVRHTGKFQTYMVLGLLAVIAVYIVAGFRHVEVERYSPLAPFGMQAVFATTGLIFISYGGLTKIAAIAEEVRNPGRNVPLGMFLAFIVISAVYVVVIAITVGVLDGGELSRSLTPISLGAKAFMGNYGGILLAVAAILAFVTTGNAGILAASRSPMAMSRDQLLPNVFQKVNRRFGTPHVSILLTSMFMLGVILFLDIEELVKTASTLKLLLFAFVNLSLIVMRESKIPIYRPRFRAPLYPWLQIAAVAVYAFLIYEMGAVPLIITGMVVALGGAWYWLYARTGGDRQSALIHVVERLASTELGKATLDTELTQILRERDNIVEDRFDKLIRECDVLDIDGPISAETLFRRIAESFAKRLGVDENLLFDLLLAREKQSSTVVQPGLAIPHIVVDGEYKFDILIARCRKGVVFSESQPPVQLVFVLGGSRDERNFHLRALMSIAQIVQEPGFEQSCINARNAEELRNLVLVAERQREAQSCDLRRTDDNAK